MMWIVKPHDFQFKTPNCPTFELNLRGSGGVHIFRDVLIRLSTDTGVHFFNPDYMVTLLVGEAGRNANRYETVPAPTSGVSLSNQNYGSYTAQVVAYSFNVLWDHLFRDTTTLIIKSGIIKNWLRSRATSRRLQRQHRGPVRGAGGAPCRWVRRPGERPGYTSAWNANLSYRMSWS